MRSRVTMVLAVLAVLLGAGLLVPTAYAKLAGDGGGLGGIGGGAVEQVPAPTPTAPPPPTLTAGPVAVNFKGDFFGWALMDRTTGKVSGSKNMASTNSTESMLKAWIVSDYLRQLGDKEPTAALKKDASLAIRDSNDDAANRVYKAAGGSYKVPAGGQPGPVVKRAISICGLTDTTRGTAPGYEGWWSFTRMSPRDAVKLGDCIADGKAAGRKWTKWVLNEMAKVRGSVTQQQARSGGGKWGIVDGLPAEIKAQGPVSIKNGWTPINSDGNWHVNCLAVTDKWSLAVMLRYPQSSKLEYGAKICASVATQLVSPQPGAALKVPQQPVGKL
ncbi:hypothetical protein V6U81_19520 [Micromonospora sp. CPCC 205711]|uniref:hypothetical protein n=1 Tax=Micromonospora sp. CPCC 205547 TaxID=3122400 RepID=UPI002FF109EB